MGRRSGQSAGYAGCDEKADPIVSTLMSTLMSTLTPRLLSIAAYHRYGS
jgi:hypothetical protein